LLQVANDERPIANDVFLMRIAYLECFSGMSGDMFMGALVDAGIPARLLEETVSALGIGASLRLSRVMRSGISATKVDVWVNGEKDMPREEYWEKHGVRQHAHSHEENNRHGHLHAHNATIASSTTPNHATHKQPHGRSLTEIKQMISQAAISAMAKTKAIAMFEALGTAEAKIHNVSIEDVHFHEVGAADAIVDIVCAAVGAEALEVGEIVCSPLNVGGGTVKCAHGTFPVPAPATVELLKDAPVYSSGLEAELVTPTGAAIVKTLASRFAPFPQMRIYKSGFGAGTRDFPRQPNVVRLTTGESAQSFATNITAETITVLEANLDDLNPQIFGYVMDRLLEEGALDVFAVPVQMKKNRPGTLLTILCRTEDATRLTQMLFTETTTLGVRRREEARAVLARRWESVPTAWGDVRIKIASMNGSVTNYAPEYEDCRLIAADHHVPLKQVMGAAVEAYVRLGKNSVNDAVANQPDDEPAFPASSRTAPSRTGKKRAR
jgi:pyridinium-3,5-bisthiocarboxylic acid mononucleotide nickel chelatase